MEAELIADGGLRLSLDRHETRLLAELLKEMKLLLEADIPRSDPVRARLFPDAYEDPDDAAGYRELTSDDLLEHKREALRRVTRRLPSRGALDAALPDDEITAWLSLLADLRLAIGTRLDVTEEDMAAEPDPSSPDAAAMNVLHWLGYVQGTMLEALGMPGGSR